MLLRQNSNLTVFLKGMAMGIADIIPGVSGGTIAFITGIYSKLIENISAVDHLLLKELLRFNFKAVVLKLDLKFLGTLFTGILSSIFLFASLISFLLEHYSTYTWAFFFGLVLCSIFVLLLRIPNKFQSSNIIALIGGTSIGHMIVTITPSQTPESFFFIFISGFIAISAMILPGISGSFLLLILGKYAFITGALKSISSIESLKIVFIFALGCLAGLVSFSKVIRWALNHYESLVMSLMTGFIAGSLQKIWPWRKVTDSILVRGKRRILAEENYIPELSSTVYISLALFLLGIIIVYLLEKVSKKQARR